MIVGTKTVVAAELLHHCKTSEALTSYALSLVPAPLQHIPAIVSNQKYLVALHVRKLQTLTWHQRKQLCEELLNGCRIKGTVDALYDYNDLLQAIDCKAFEQYMEEEARRAEG